jgi:hypothetical protein
MIYTHAVFEKIQSHVAVTRDRCFVQNITENEETEIVTISSLSGKEGVVHFNKSNMFSMCSCKLFDSNGIPCCHVIQVLRAEKLNEISLVYIMKRWQKRCTRYVL